MKFDMENLNPGTVFNLVDGKPEDGQITLRVCNTATLDEIRSKTTKRVVEFRRGQRFETVQSDDAAFSDLMWDYAIVDWAGIVDAKGKPIPCTKENKSALMRGSVAFSRIVGDLIAKLSDELEERREEAAKN